MRARDGSPERALIRRVASIPGVTIGRSRFGDRTAVFIEGVECAHFHDAREVDVRLTRSALRRHQADLEREPGIDKTSLRSRRDWCVFVVKRSRDVDRVARWLRLAIEQNRWRGPGKRSRVRAP